MQLSDQDAAQRNLCSDPNPGMLGTTNVLCLSCLKQRDQISDYARLLSARSRPLKRRVYLLISTGNNFCARWRIIFISPDGT